ncbi:hypothetical protein BKA65DRAFT_492954 [Rhexocercosporidium sp. MPI-PUGE-AT-0058]|nr:hypothetical protein BKA65DRAFT_492954 [Rhexocercosporidium sp. MPI-PUGE-AT-0058]
MSCKLPSTALRRAQLPLQIQCNAPRQTQIRHASLLKRPHRPYTFTQLVTLSDGSTYTHRTTSPAPIFRSTKDTRNHPMWQPSLDSLRNVEQDEAGKLRAFRKRFGRGWDVDGAEEAEGEHQGKEGRKGGEGFDGEGDGESLMDLISGVKPEPETGKGKKSGLEELMAAVENSAKDGKTGKEAKRVKGGKKGGVWG